MGLQHYYIKTRQFSNHESHLLSRSHIFAIIVILDLTPYLQKLEPKVIDPLMTFNPMSVEVTCVNLPKDHCNQVPWKYIKVCEYSDFFFKKLEPKVIDP